MVHKLLARQLATATGDDGTVDVARLAELVDNAYETADRDRRRTNRSMTLMVEEIEQAQQRLLGAIDLIPEGVVLLDAEDRHVLWNTRYADLHGCFGQRLAIGVPYVEALREALRNGVFPDATGQEEAWLAERLRRHRLGHNRFEERLSGDRWVLSEERRTRDGGSIGIRIDITEMKRREASFRLLFDNNPVPMWVYDQATNIFVAVNDAAISHYGYSREQFIGMSLFEIIPPEDWEDVQRVLANVFGKGSRCSRSRSGLAPRARRRQHHQRRDLRSVIRIPRATVTHLHGH